MLWLGIRWLTHAVAEAATNLMVLELKEAHDRGSEQSDSTFFDRLVTKLVQRRRD